MPLWGFKSPFASLYLDELREACDKAGEDMYVIKTIRPYEETVHSLAKAAMLEAFRGQEDFFDGMVEMQEKLKDVKHSADLEVNIEDIWAQPQKVVDEVCELLNIKKHPLLTEMGTWGIENRGELCH